MTREELYTKIYETIVSNENIIIDNKSDIQEDFQINGITSALSFLSSNIQNGILKIFVQSLSQKINDDELDNVNYIVSKSSFTTSIKKRNFIWNSLDLSVINGETLLNPSNYDLDNDQIDDILLIIERICCDDHNREEFISCLLSNVRDNQDYYVIINSASQYIGIDVWKLYMYALSLFVNSGKTIIANQNLLYNKPTPWNSSVVFNTDAKYEQYIDIYDVISEWNNCTDVLNGFLKMYQILEYMIYRKEFVSIVKGANIKQSFVRQIKGLDRKYSNSERDAFKKGFKEVLSTFSGGAITSAMITNEAENFCKKYYPCNGSSYMQNAITDPNQIDNCIAMFIYDTRCSIVHNKESEFHISSINYEIYKPIVPLMKNVMNVVGEKIIETISKDSNCIQFDNPSIPLY